MVSKRRVLIPAILAAINGGVAAADVIVASNFPRSFQYSGFRTDIGYWSNINNRPSNTAAAQPFVPAQSGTLSTLTVFARRSVGGAPLRVSIHQDQSGQPGSKLGELSFLQSAFPTDYFPPNPPTSLDLSALGILLEAGTRYHVAFRTDTAVYHDFRYALHTLNPHPASFDLTYLYSPDGTATWQTGSFSLEVALQVAIIPEPAGLLALGPGLVIWMTFGRVPRGTRRRTTCFRG